MNDILVFLVPIRNNYPTQAVVDSHDIHTQIRNTKGPISSALLTRRLVPST